MNKSENSLVSEKPESEHTPTQTLKNEIARLRKLREDVLLLRFHVARRTDMTTLIDDTDRLTSETALKSSLEILERMEKGEVPPIGHVSSATSALMYAVDALVNAARLAEEKTGTRESPLPITPESLRASLPEADIAATLGEKLPSKRRKAATKAGEFLINKTFQTFFCFALALLLHFAVTSPSALKYVSIPQAVMIPVSAFVWAFVGSLVWILIRFRRFGATYSFDPAHAEVFEARVFSGAVLTAVLLFFVFGGENPWAENWQVNLPLSAFVLGYAGRLQVEVLRNMVERVGRALARIAPQPTGRATAASTEKKDEISSEEKVPADTEPPPLEKKQKPERQEGRERASENQ